MPRKIVRDPTSPKIEFIQYHQPALDSGLYHVRLEQTLDAVPGKIGSPQTWSRELAFAVLGERFGTLAPHELSAVFPARDSLGDHQNVLPHITVKRSTLPWERAPSAEDELLPWLALLIVRDSDFERVEDAPRVEVMTLGQLQTDTRAKFPSFDYEPGQSAADEVTVVDLPKALLARILPTKRALDFLAHVRQPKDAGGAPLGEQLATVISNRLPMAGGTSTAYLVSVENRYLPDQGGVTGGFDYQDAGDGDLIRFVCLSYWRFSCTEPKYSFRRLLLDADRAPSTPRLADVGEADADRHLAAGYVPLPHALRQGDRTVSWFHGPLAPGRADGEAAPDDLPALNADALMRYDAEAAMFDVSYAAAWQLGRLLTLENEPIALALQAWKRASTGEEARAVRRHRHLPLRAAREPELPAELETWFRELALLHHIPFDYLIPDTRQLPVESLRFFHVDARWVQCLLDGAYSLGRITEGDRRRDRARGRGLGSRASNPIDYADRVLSGILLRSAAVVGWPELQVEGYAAPVRTSLFRVTGQDPLPIARFERLSPNTLLCLFSGDVATVDIHVKPESLHFGVDPADGDPPVYYKTLRDPLTGEEDDDRKVAVPWQDEAFGVVDVERLVGHMEEVRRRTGLTSAQYALHMIEGDQKVRFIIEGNR